MATGGYFMSFISLCIQGLLKHLRCSSEKLTILSYGTLELNERVLILPGLPCRFNRQWPIAL